MENIDKALFFALKRGDFQLAHSLYQKGGNLHAIFEEEKGQYISSLNIFIRNFSQLAYSKGPNVAAYKRAMEFFNAFIGKINLECKCQKQHKCPLYFALQGFKITSEDDILKCKSDIPRSLIVNGATIQFEDQQDRKAEKKLAKWSLKWLDIAGLRAYLITKSFRLVEIEC